MVYRELLVYPETEIYIERPRKDPSRVLGYAGNDFPLQLEPVMLRLSQQTKEEGSTMLYSQNHFDLQNLLEIDGRGEEKCEMILMMFARAIGRKNAQRIRHVNIAFPCVSQDDNRTLHGPWLTEPMPILELLASEYDHVKTIETSLGECGEIEGPALDDPQMTKFLVK